MRRNRWRAVAVALCLAAGACSSDEGDSADTAISIPIGTVPSTTTSSTTPLTTTTAPATTPPSDAAPTTTAPAEETTTTGAPATTTTARPTSNVAPAPGEVQFVELGQIDSPTSLA